MKNKWVFMTIVLATILLLAGKVLCDSSCGSINGGPAKCGCWKNECWSYKTEDRTAQGDPWCYLAPLGDQTYAGNGVSCSDDQDCSWEMFCKDNQLYTGEGDPFSNQGQQATFAAVNAENGKTTRYWDCCKPSCAWGGKASVTKEVDTCNIDGTTVQGTNWEKNGCEDGGTSYMCNTQQPWADPNDPNLSYGFAAVKLTGRGEDISCCACYELTFTSTAIAGKKMIVQATNTGGDLGENHFDLQMPGGGVGIFNGGCMRQWNAPADGWGQRYGGVSSQSECDQLPEQLRPGCNWRFEWFQNADNPTIYFSRVRCPQAIIDQTQCVRDDDNQI